MATNAISRIDDKSVRARLDDYGCDGTFANDGSVIAGTLGTLPQEEMAYRIWRQIQDIRISETKLRQMWNARHKNK